LPVVEVLESSWAKNPTVQIQATFYVVEENFLIS
jgi:hypothetical protein